MRKMMKRRRRPNQPSSRLIQLEQLNNRRKKRRILLMTMQNWSVCTVWAKTTTKMLKLMKVVKRKRKFSSLPRAT